MGRRARQDSPRAAAVAQTGCSPRAARESRDRARARGAASAGLPVDKSDLRFSINIEKRLVKHCEPPGFISLLRRGWPYLSILTEIHQP